VIHDVDWVAIVFAEDPVAPCASLYTGLIRLRIDNIHAGKATPISEASCFNQHPLGATLSASSYAPCNAGNLDGGIRLVANGDPALVNQFGFLIMGTAAAQTPVTVFQGELCVAAPQLRYDPMAGSAYGPEFNSLGYFVGSGQFRLNSAPATPWFDLPVRLPGPAATLMTLGVPYYLQMWHRLPGGGATFSNMLEVRFH